MIIVELMEQEMDETKKIFDEQNSNFTRNKALQFHRNLPEVSGTLKWCQELRERIQRPLINFDKLIDHPIKQSDDMNRVHKKHEELMALLDAFTVGPYKTWCDHVGTLSNNNLEKNLLVRDPKTRVIQTNFDPQVCFLFYLKRPQKIEIKLRKFQAYCRDQRGQIYGSDWPER
jgi:dynein heavy chain